MGRVELRSTLWMFAPSSLLKAPPISDDVAANSGALGGEIANAKFFCRGLDPERSCDDERSTANCFATWKVDNQSFSSD